MRMLLLRIECRLWVLLIKKECNVSYSFKHEELTFRRLSIEPLFPISKIPFLQLKKTNMLRITPLNGVSVSPFFKFSKLHLHNSLK